MQWLSRLERLIDSHLLRDVPMAGKTSLGIGGPARVFLPARNMADLKKVSEFATAEDVPLWVIGGGTNLLVHDEGLNGIVVSSLGLHKLKWEIQKEEVHIITESGVPLSKILQLSMQSAWSGLEFASGIPGTVGGALAGNAGAGGKGLCDVLEWVETIEPGGNSRTWLKKEIRFSYRKCSLSLDRRIIIRCSLNLRTANAEQVQSAIESFQKKRSMQPRSTKTAGCVFKNPDRRISAGRLLDLAGCKGLRLGGVKVSEIHANFLEVEKNASARDVYAVIEECRRRVYESSGVWLELEIRLLGGPWGK